MRKAYLAQYPVSTQRVYSGTLTEFDLVTGGKVEDAVVSDVLYYNEYIADQAAATRNRKIATLSSYSAFLIKIGERTNNPFLIIRRPKADPYRSINWLTPEETQALLDAARDDKRGLAFILLGLHGLRVSEIVGLNVEQYRSGALWNVRGKGGMSRNIPLAAAAQTALDAYVGTRARGAIFRSRRGRLSVRRAQSMIYEISEQSGRRINVHALRHTFGTQAIRSGNPTIAVQKVMGHASPVTTAKYVHLDDADTRKVVESTLRDLSDASLLVIDGGKTEHGRVYRKKFRGQDDSDRTAEGQNANA